MQYQKGKKIMVFHEKINQLEAILVPPINNSKSKHIKKIKGTANCKYINDSMFMDPTYKPVMYHSQIRPEWNDLFMEMYRDRMTKFDVCHNLTKLLNSLNRKKEIKRWDVLCILFAERHIALSLSFFDDWIVNGGVKRMQELWDKFLSMPTHLEEKEKSNG